MRLALTSGRNHSINPDLARVVMTCGCQNSIVMLRRVHIRG
jgi:hypothetical protein